MVRRVILGDAARDDTELTGLLARLRAQAELGDGRPGPPTLTAEFLDRLRAHLDRAEPGSLAAVAAATPADAHTAAVEQVPQWLFAFDAAGLSAFRALALLATHPRELAAVRAEIADGPGVPAELPACARPLLEAVRLWPTTPAILRETTSATELGGATLPRGTLVLICSAFFHRDGERHTWADDFTPRLWSGEDPRAALVPFSGGPAVCAGQDLVLFLTSTFLAGLLDGQEVRQTSRPRDPPGRPLPGTLDPFHLRFTTRSRADPCGEPVGPGRYRPAAHSDGTGTGGARWCCGARASSRRWSSPLLVAAMAVVPALRDPRFYLTDDSAAQFLPSWYHLGQLLRAGRFPLLDPTLWAGGNIAAEALFGVWNPVLLATMLLVSAVPNLVVASVAGQGRVPGDPGARRVRALPRVRRAAGPGRRRRRHRALRRGDPLLRRRVVVVRAHRLRLRPLVLVDAAPLRPGRAEPGRPVRRGLPRHDRRQPLRRARRVPRGGGPARRVRVDAAARGGRGARCSAGSPSGSWPR